LIKCISIIGLGIVGLATATVFASKGIKVIGVEKDDHKKSLIRDGEVPFYEPKLKNMLEYVLKNKKFTITKDISSIRHTTLTFITVGTPSQSNGKLDNFYIKESSREIGNVLSKEKKYHTIIVKSTVLPGTTENVIGKTISKYSNKIINKDFGLAFNPEFLKEGSAINDSLFPHILVVGASNAKSKRSLISFYRSIYKRQQN
jgi:nucleotide sugar dehydrogenase